MFYAITVTAMQPLTMLRTLKGRPVYAMAVAKFDGDDVANATCIDIDSVGENGDMQTVSVPIAYVPALIAGLEQALAKTLEAAERK